MHTRAWLWRILLVKTPNRQDPENCPHHRSHTFKQGSTLLQRNHHIKEAREIVYAGILCGACQGHMHMMTGLPWHAMISMATDMPICHHGTMITIARPVVQIDKTPIEGKGKVILTGAKLCYVGNFPQYVYSPGKSGPDLLHQIRD